MTDTPDARLLEQFARNESEAAFAELVKRYIGLVYSVAFRTMGNPQQAEDVTQAVFIVLARKANSMGAKTVLPGWLYNTARLTAANAHRAEIRRIRREQEACMQSTAEEPVSAIDALWRELSPQLDEAMACLGTTERDALVLRYFQNKSVAEVGTALGVQENTAQQRVGRALEKLRKFFARRGVASTTAIIAGVISANSVEAAPAGLAQTISTVAVAKGAAASASTLTLVKGGLKVMAWTKTQTAVVVVACVLLATGTATVVIREADSNSIREQVLDIVKTHESDSSEGAAMIARIGPNALPTLEELIRWRKSWWDFSGVAEHEKMRASAMRIVSDIGPAAVRPLTSVLCDAVNDFDAGDLSTFVPATGNGFDTADFNTLVPAATALFHYSVPGSPKAVATLTNWLANPVLGDFSYWNDNLSCLPDAVNWLVPRLKNPDDAYGIAHNLGLMGPNAAAAVPALIEVCERGKVTDPPPYRFQGWYWYTPPGKKKPVWRSHMYIAGMTDEQKERNRSYAMEALGQIGVASPEVVTTLERALDDPNDLVRFGALKAIYALHLQPERPLADVLNSFTPRRGTSFTGIVDWTGHLGNEGHDALPWLQRLRSFDYVSSLPEGVHANVGWDLAVSTEDLQGAATLAVLEIDPSQINPQEVNRAQLLRHFWAATKQEMEESNAAVVLAILRPLLVSSNPDDASLAAHFVLGFVPNDERAVQTLRRCADDGNPNLKSRMVAAE